MGLTHKLKTVVEVMLLDHKQWEHQLKVIKGIENVLCLQVYCFFLFVSSASHLTLVTRLAASS